MDTLFALAMTALGFGLFFVVGAAAILAMVFVGVAVHHGIPAACRETWSLAHKMLQGFS